MISDGFRTTHPQQKRAHMNSLEFITGDTTERRSMCSPRAENG
jgi:hypothetical protein